MKSIAKYVISTMEKNYEAVGFIPALKIESYERSGQILIAKENGQQPCGYLIFGNGHPRIRIYQACIQYDARRREHGLRLISQLMQIGRLRNCELISLWCASDLEANVFWKTAGFSLSGMRVGGAKRGRIHNLWTMAIPSSQMTLDLLNQ